MKKSFSPRSLTLSIIAISLLTIIIILTTTSSKASSPLGTRLSGKILLQVEDHGKAWYVSPNNDNQRIYLGSPEEAHCLMKTLGLGISNNDLNRYLNDNDNKFPTRLSGKILLAVEQHGEAYYINPDNLKGYYLGRPIDALKLMRELSLGITNTNLNTIPVLDNTEMLKKCNITKTEEQQENTETNISLVTNPVAPMTNFSHIVSISATLTNPDNISIKERGLLYDFTIFPNTNLTPTLDKYNQKLISETSSQDNTYTINLSNLIPGSYPFIRSYAITGNNQIIYGNTINITGVGSNNLPSSLISSPLPVYTLTYTAGANGTLSGSAVQNISKNSNGSAITAVPNTGYHFVNWSDGLTANPRTDTNITSDLSVTANFAINTYTVTFEDHNGSFISSSSVNHGSGATAPAPPTIVGYTFTSWDVAFNNITSDLTVTAQYTINSYTLTYTAGAGGSLTGSTTQEITYGGDGEEVIATPNDGYEFVKWSDGLTTNSRTDTNISGNITVEAEFVATFACGTDVTDARDGKTYKTVAIGSQCWFKENLAYLPMVHSNDQFQTQGIGKSPGYGVYGYDGGDVATAKLESNYSTYGVLYNWYAVSTTTNGNTNLCPDGWHVPTDAEWTELVAFLGGEDIAGGKMKQEGTEYWNSPNTGADNSSGFTALPAGYRVGIGNFYDLGGYAHFWSSCEDDPGNSWYRFLGSGYAGVTRVNGNQANGYSVRCLRTE